LEMSSSLGQDYDEFKFARENQLGTNDIEESLHNFNNNSLDTFGLECCQLCDKKFETKRDRQTHIVLVHLRSVRIKVRKISYPKNIEGQSNNTYLLEKEHTSDLKITLKKQSAVIGDCLKLKLKKSPASESFTVVSAVFGSDKESVKQDNELAETQEKDCKDESEEEKKTEDSFINVMLNQEDNYDDDDNLGSDPDNNPLENSERPSMDNNEGDSGVGSDSVNPLEREDQNVDDLHTDSISNVDPAESTENDQEESDILEATCRETIENLKKLGEQSSSRSELLESSEETIEQPKTNEKEEEEKTTEVRSIPDPIPELRGNSEISIVPRSALMPEQPRRSSMNNVETEILPVGGNSHSSFSWTRVTENSSRHSEENGCEVTDKDNSDNAENAGSLLQNFLIEQQRNQNETNNGPTLETEYVSLERLADTVNTCRVCNEKFKDIAHLDAHRSKAGHYQCNIPECTSLVFTTPAELSTHKSHVHAAPASPSLSVSPHLSQNSPHSSRSPHLNQASPHLNSHSPHSPSVQGGQVPQGSPITSPHASSPSYGTQSPNTYPPVSLEQLPAPVQQLAQQVQRMPLPQQQQPGGLPPGVTMTSGGNYYQAQGRPPMYRVQAPVQYPPHLTHMYPQYGGHYGQMGMQSQMQPQMLQQMPRGRYPAMIPGQRAPRMPQVHVSSPVPRPRLKRPMMPQPGQVPQQLQGQSPGAPKQRRMDVLLPGGSEDADCHVIAQQKRNDGLPVIQNVQGGATVQASSRSDSTIHLTDSITLSVRQPGHNPAQVNAMVQGAKKPDASAVANVLAARGITVTPASSRKSLDQSSQPQQQQQTQQQKQLSALNLNSAISIIPASSQKKQQEQQGQFAVPQNKQNKQQTSEVERPPRPPTVDLTQDSPSLLPARRGRPPRMPVPLTCQVCDKRFQSQEILAQHMATHRTTNKLHHKCNLCPAQYPTAQALATHKNTYHREADASFPQNGNIELALPVVDLKSAQTLNRLAGLGIKSYIPLSQLSAQTGGYFALPIVSIDGARNPNSSNLAALGAASILSLGPLKHLSNR
ncbi:hypothetical protein QAD02_024206, partial [Eretmocerus hayati]